MLNMDELREMAAITPDAEYYVSLYLNVDPVTNPGGEYAIRFRNMLKDASERIDKKALKAVKEDLEKIESYFMASRRKFRKSLSILSSKARDFWREYHLSVPVRSELVVEKTPYLEPLLDIMDRYRRYLVVLVDKEKARIFVTQLGEMVEYAEVHSADVPGRHKKGGWFALAEYRYKRHVEYHVGMHIADVLGEMEGFIQRQKIEGIVVGGPEEVLSMFLDRLPGEAAQNVIGTFSAAMYENSVDVLQKAEPVLRRFERGQTEEAIEELITRVYKNEQAVAGMEDVLLMTQEKRIMRLLVDSDFRRGGYLCKNCGALNLEPERCRWCGGKPEEVNYMVDLIMQRTVEQGGSVEVVPDSEKLKKAGNIGALLRY